MRISHEDLTRNPLLRTLQFHVKLDGQPIKHVLMADEENGKVEHIPDFLGPSVEASGRVEITVVQAHQPTPPPEPMYIRKPFR